MGVYNAEIFNNLGLCCYYAQQFDMALSCFQRALTLASSNTLADVWYNIGHIAVVKKENGLTDGQSDRQIDLWIHRETTYCSHMSTDV